MEIINSIDCKGSYYSYGESGVRYHYPKENLVLKEHAYKNAKIQKKAHNKVKSY
jgi:hypothetical protein